MTVADVPVTELAGLRCRGQDLIPSGDLSAHGSPTALLLVDEFGVICQDQGQIGLSGFVHVASMDRIGEESKGPGPVPQPSHLTLDPFPFGDLDLRGNLTTTVVTLLHLDCKLLVVHVGSDVIDLDDPTREGGVGTTDVEVGFVCHADLLLTGGDGSWVQVDSPPTVTSPSLQE